MEILFGDGVNNHSDAADDDVVIVSLTIGSQEIESAKRKKLIAIVKRYFLLTI